MVLCCSRLKKKSGKVTKEKIFLKIQTHRPGMELIMHSDFGPFGKIARPTQRESAAYNFTNIQYKYAPTRGRWNIFSWNCIATYKKRVTREESSLRRLRLTLHHRAIIFFQSANRQFISWRNN